LFNLCYFGELTIAIAAAPHSDFIWRKRSRLEESHSARDQFVIRSGFNGAEAGQK
jgi:hypothetical protein